MFVIDTISFRCKWPLRLESHNDWRFAWEQKDLATGDDEETTPFIRTFKAYHRIFGIYVTGENGQVTFVSVSLPRMFHENNAVLIENQPQLDESLSNLRDIITEIAETSAPLLYFTRVDLVWQFQHSPVALIRAHRQCVFPRCRPKRREFSERSASWDYSDKRIIMYDKRLKDRGAPGNVVRVEIQLYKASLRQYLSNNNDAVTELNFAGCYQAFRTLMTTFAPSRQVAIPGDKYEVFALIDRQARDAGLTSPLDLWLSIMKARTARVWRKRTTAAELCLEGFSWEDVLPESGPPEPVAGY